MSGIGVQPSTRQYDKDNGQVGLVAPTSRLWAPGTASLIASRATAVRFVPSRNMTIQSIGFIVTTAAGSDDACDVGIYDATLNNKLVSAGATLGRLNSTGQKFVPVAATRLVAGATYYAAFSSGTQATTAATLGTASYQNASFANVYGAAPPALDSAFLATSHPLPASLSAAAATGVPVLLIVSES